MNVNKNASISRAMREDLYYKKYKAILENCKLDLDELQEEAIRIHKMRDSRTLALKSNISGKRIVKAALNDSAYRSRLVEIRSMLKHQTTLLSTAHNLVTSSLLSRFGNTILKDLRTKTEKEAVIDTLPDIDSGSRKLSTMYTLCELCDDVIEDIDKSAWTLKLAMQGLELTIRGE